MDEAFGLILGFNQFFFLLVGFGIRFGVFDHFFNIGIRQTAGGLNTDSLFFVGRFIFGGNVNDAVGVNIKRNLNLRHAARCRRNAD